MNIPKAALRLLPLTAVLLPLASCGSGGGGGSAGIGGSASVLQYHKRPSRDGLYIDSLARGSAIAGTRPTPGFSALVTGPVYSQPLFIENGVPGKDLLIVATEQNEVVALDAATGTRVWSRT